jgi:septum formation protein
VFQQAEAAPVILASGSSTRARMLAAAGVAVSLKAATVDESAIKEALRAEGIAAGDAAVALAELKAQRVAAQTPAEAIVFGADQILTCEGHWFDKPADKEGAHVQLQALAGRRHDLWTAAVAFRNDARVWHHLSHARLWMRACSPAFLDAYLAALGADALSSVGVYQVEGLGAHLFARIEGDHFAIQGLPLLEVLDFLRTHGVLLQ